MLQRDDNEAVDDLQGPIKAKSKPNSIPTHNGLLDNALKKKKRKKKAKNPDTIDDSARAEVPDELSPAQK